MNKALRSSSLSLLLVSLCACGGGNNTATPTGPTGNIPALATKPTPQASQLKKVRLTGTIFNSLNGAPVEKAEVLIQILTASSASTTGSTPSTGSTPAPNAPIPTLPDTTIPTQPPSITPPSSTPPSIAPASPVSTAPPLVAPASPKPSAASPSKPPDLPPADGGKMPGAFHRVPGQGLFSARGAQAASFQLAQAEVQSGAKEDELNLFRADSNNKGKFFLNDVPDGRYLLTVTAPGYTSLSITDVNVSNQIDVPLTPIDGPKVIDVVGMVLSPSEKPVVDAIVSPSFPVGEAIGVPDTTNQLGEFNLPDVPYGVHSLVAFVMNEDQQIKQMGILPGAPISDTSLKVKHPAMQPGKKPGSHSKQTPSAAPESSQPTARPGGKTPKPTAKPADEPTAKPSAASSAKPATPAKSPAPAASAATGKSLQSPAVTDNQPGLARFQEHEEKEEDKTFNILDQITELVTGEKPKPAQGNHDFYPVIPLHSVLNQVALAGTVELPEGYEAKRVEVYLSLPAAKKGDTPEEAYLFSQPLNAAEPAASASPGASPAPAAAAPGKKPPVRFRLNLPNLDKGQSYHLQFTASKDSGEISYHHLYNLGKSDEELKVDFLTTTGKIRLEGEEINAVVPVPNFSWDAITGAEIYHVSLESGNNQTRRIVWEAWTKDTQIKFPLTTKAQRLQERTTYRISVEALKGLHPASNDIKKQYALPAYQAIWTDLARLSHTPFEVVE